MFAKIIQPRLIVSKLGEAKASVFDTALESKCDVIHKMRLLCTYDESHRGAGVGQVSAWAFC